MNLPTTFRVYKSGSDTEGGEILIYYYGDQTSAIDTLMLA
jgi:hypothetical protein